MTIFILKRKYILGSMAGSGGNRVKSFTTSIFMAEKKEDLDYDFNPFTRNSISRDLIPQLWDSLKEGEVTEFRLGWRNSSLFSPTEE